MKGTLRERIKEDRGRSTKRFEEKPFCSTFKRANPSTPIPTKNIALNIQVNESPRHFNGENWLT
jgi:hypothetical protein